MMSTGKQVLDIEQDVRRLSRQSVVTTRAIQKGETVARDALTIKRPGTGIEPWRIESIVGRTAARKIEPDRPVREDDIA